MAAPGGLPGACARALALALGDSRLDLAEARGRPYPDAVPGWSPLFQHCAIVTADFGAAMARLRRRTGLARHLDLRPGGAAEAFRRRHRVQVSRPRGAPARAPILSERDGPEDLATGPRDDPCLGIDHSAISVADTELSVAFYARLV